MRRALLLALAACSSGPSKSTTVAEPPPPQRHEPPQDRQPDPLPQVVDAKPDVPGGAAAKRDAELAERAAGFFDAFVSNEPAWTPDGKRVVFVSNRDGLPQLYIADATKPTAPATRLLTTKERVGDPFVTRDGKALLFASDVGADELWSIYRANLDGSGVIDLTPGERLNRDGFLVPDKLPATMFFSARKMSEPKSTLYSASTTTPGPAKAIYTDELPAFLSDVASDGKRVLFTQYPSASENYLLAIDVASGKAERVYPAEGNVSINAAQFSVDGKLAYIGTDAGGEAAVVLAIDLATKKVVAKHEVVPPSADIIALEVSSKGLVALSVNAGSRSEIKILDGKTLKQKSVAKLPLGQGIAARWSEDGKKLAAQWSTPSAPQSIFAIDVAGKATALRDEPRPTLKDMVQVDASVVEIPAFDGGKIPANVYVAKGEATKPHPTLVVYHGGPAGVSQIRWNASYGFFLSLGYAIVEPNVRGSSGYGRAYEAGDNGPKRLDAFKDIETSARWVAKQPFADKDRLVVYGGSYGGYTTLVALSRWPDIWRAGVNLFGVVNLKTFMQTTSGLIRKIFLVEFGDPDKDGEFLAQISPLTDVDKIVDPLFTYAGANDPRVPRSESDLIVKAVRQRKVPNEYMVADNEGHSLGRRENVIAFLSRCARFLETHLR